MFLTPVNNYYIDSPPAELKSSAEIMEELVEKYKQKPVWETPWFQAKKFLWNLKKLPTAAKMPGSLVNKPQLVQIEIPRHVSLVIGKGNKILVTGIRGSLIHTFGSELSFEKKENVLSVSSSTKAGSTTFSTQIGILYRMLVGVTRGYKEKIKTSGVGYRGILEEKQLLTLFLGYSHRAQHSLLPNVQAKFSRKNNKINFSGPSWPAVSATAAEVHHLKKPDVYNGKGVRYRGLKLRKKEGKKQSR